jgi:hypothetical protein
LSLEQIFGHHLVIDEEGHFLRLLEGAAELYPDQCLLVSDRTFRIISPTNQDITYGADGTCQWRLLEFALGPRRNIQFLHIGVRKIWGVQYDLGMNLKKTAAEKGKKRVAAYIQGLYDKVLRGADDSVTLCSYCAPPQQTLEH